MKAFDAVSVILAGMMMLGSFGYSQWLYWTGELRVEAIFWLMNAFVFYQMGSRLAQYRGWDGPGCGKSVPLKHPIDESKVF